MSDIVVVVSDITETVEVSNPSYEVVIGDGIIQSSSAQTIGITYSASFGDSTPALVYTVPNGYSLDKIEVAVTEVFNGTGATIEIGSLIDPDRFFLTSDTELDQLTSFEKNFTDSGSFGIYLTIHPGTGATTGKLIIQLTIIPNS